MSRSLTYRLLLGASLSSTIVLGALGLSVYAAMRHALIADFRRSLEAETRLISGMIEGRGAKTKFEFDSERLADFLSMETGRFFQIWRKDGSVLARSPSLNGSDLPRLDTLPSASEVDLPGGRRGQAVVFTYLPGQEDHEDEKLAVPAEAVTILVAASPIEVVHTLRLLSWLLTAACALAVIVMGAVLLRVVSQGVQPVKLLASEIESLTEADLGRRFSREPVPDELLPVVDKLNGLLGRLQGAFAREKSFTADVAHELRTPLTGLRATLEVCRSQPRKAAAYETAIDECRSIVDRMESMVESLLLLARSDAGQLKATRRPVDLPALILQNWCLFQDRAESRGVTTTFDLADSPPLETDAERLSIVIRNLLDNAVSYVDPNGRIRISIARANDRAVVEIANSGSRITTEDAARLFERFWRGDQARTDAGDHCGLGLSLCQRLITLLDGEISVSTTKGGEFICRLLLKVAAPQASPRLASM